MGADFLLVSPALPARKNSEGKFEILTNTDLAVRIAQERLQGKDYTELVDSPYIENYAYEFITNETDEPIQEAEFNELIKSIVKEFIENYDAPDGAIITYDQPRMFSAGLSWGGSPTEVFDILVAIESLDLFSSLIRDEEIGEYRQEDWVIL